MSNKTHIQHGTCSEFNTMLTAPALKNEMNTLTIRSTTWDIDWKTIYTFACYAWRKRNLDIVIVIP